MTTIHLAIHSGDPVEMHFENTKELNEFICELVEFDCVWLVSDNKKPEISEILITESIQQIINCISNGFFGSLENEVLFIQEYPNYEDAYSVALMMRETNPKCNTNYE